VTRRHVGAHPAVDEDLAEAREFYRDIDPRLSHRFRDEYLKCLGIIGEFPEAFHAYFEVYRRVFIAGFPYLVAYRVTDDQVRVLAVVHGKRDPASIRAQLDDRA
jgi:plasmid stabilization system protein ParE